MRQSESLKSVIRELESRGIRDYRVQGTRKHPRVYFPTPEGLRFVVVAGSESDHRAPRNAVTGVRRVIGRPEKAAGRPGPAPAPTAEAEAEPVVPAEIADLLFPDDAFQTADGRTVAVLRVDRHEPGFSSSPFSVRYRDHDGKARTKAAPAFLRMLHADARSLLLDG